MAENQIQEFYDRWVGGQVDKAFNERHLFLYDNLLSFGLNSKSKVLELGCGIGVTTFLLAETIEEGSITAVDISEKSIELAKVLNHKNSNCNFVAQDLTKHEHFGESPDFILLLDVLEHIPLEQHEPLFQRIVRWCHSNTQVVVNTPTAAYNDYLREHNPNELQVIDHSLQTQQLVVNAHSAGLKLKRMETYSVWVEDQYQLAVFTTDKPFRPQVADPPANARVNTTVSQLKRRKALSRLVKHINDAS